MKKSQGQEPRAKDKGKANGGGGRGVKRVRPQVI